MSTSKNTMELTRVGPGTVTGEFMRQFWIPAARSSEVEANGPPLRLMLLGEKLIAFRDSSGRVGVMDHRCPHRCASLFLGRNEANGVRCVYHGWKFDVEGNCLDMPNVPPERDFKDRIKARAYRVHESVGVIWVYMGRRERPPELPDLEVLSLRDEQPRILMLQRECNWLQALEGDIDSSHLGLLHLGAVKPDDLGEGHPAYYTVSNRVPSFHVTRTPWGTSSAAYRRAADGQVAWRINNFIFPFFTQTAQMNLGDFACLSAWVPMDDEHTMLIRITAGMDEGAHTFAPQPMRNGQRIPGTEPERYLPNTTDWFGRWRTADDHRSDWGIDRNAQSRGISFSGIPNVNMQDQAVTESMGPITDHDLEHLSISDRMITVSRRELLAAADAFAESGIAPPGIEDPSVYRNARSGTFKCAESTQWHDAMETFPRYLGIAPEVAG